MSKFLKEIKDLCYKHNINSILENNYCDICKKPLNDNITNIYMSNNNDNSYIHSGCYHIINDKNKYINLNLEFLISFNKIIEKYLLISSTNLIIINNFISEINYLLKFKDKENHKYLSNKLKILIDIKNNSKILHDIIENNFLVFLLTI